MNKQHKKRFLHMLTTAVITLFFVSTVLSSSLSNQNDIMDGKNQSIPSAADENYYTWEDTFDNAQKIDESYSEQYLVQNGKAVMYGTYPQWTNADWTRMKEIPVISEQTIEDTVIKITVEYDSDMKADYSDLRFKFNNDDYWLDYWIEEINPEPNNPYALVWVRIVMLPQGNSTISVFYGNPSATDQSDYWSVFDENSWQNYYAHDHKITVHMESEGAWDPDVSWGDNKFLVTWEEGIPRYLPLGMIWRQQIRGCFHSEEGDQVGPRFDITEWNDNPSIPFRCENPATAYGESGSNKIFFIAYEQYNTPSDVLSRDIKGALVPMNANSIDDVTHFDICLSNGNQADPVVSYDDENKLFFVVWEDGRQGTSNYNIYGRFFDINGNPVGPEKIISSRPNSQCEPWITFDDVNNHYMIVWEEGIDAANGPFEIWGQLFTVNGNQLGDAQRLSPSGSSGTDYNFPCVAFCSLTERYIITWQEDDISNGEWYGHIWGKILNENGETAIDTFKIAHGAYERTNVVSHLSSSFFVVYDGGGDVWGKLVSSKGEVNLYVLQLSDSESDPADWANIASSGDHIFVSWEDLRVNYVEPYERLNLPDIYCNVWSFNTPSGSEISYTFSDEHSLVLTSSITSDPIAPENLDSWHMFEAVKQGDITFDVMDGNNPTNVIMADISSGTSLQNIKASSIRLRATFQRTNPSSSPFLDAWSVSYVGEDDDPPETSIEHIQGEQGLNEWYISESVIVWLHAEDFPQDTGSGIKAIYYTLNDGEQQTYNEASGLKLTTSQSSNWKGEWTIVFWASDNAGNIESRDAAENQRVVKIDADRPYVEITSPANEEQVETPFWVRANPSDNVDIDRVEFDIEPFGEREGLPYVDSEAPYEWYCDVEEMNALLFSNEFVPVAGANVMVRAQAFDESGQSWTDEIWVYITNWDSTDGFFDSAGFIVGLGQSFYNMDMISSELANDHIPSCIMLGRLEWDFNQGFFVSAGTNGVFKKSGSQSGSAQLFFGVASRNNNLFAGFAFGINVD